MGCGEYTVNSKIQLLTVDHVQKLQVRNALGTDTETESGGERYMDNLIFILRRG